MVARMITPRFIGWFLSSFVRSAQRPRFSRGASQSHQAPTAASACWAAAPALDLRDPVDRAPPLTQDPGDRGHGIPVARGDRYPKEPVERAKVADDLHVPPVQTEDEPVVPREDFQQPR